MNMFDEPEIKEGRKGMGSHQSADMLKDAWLTPPEQILKPLGVFNVDPCAPIDRPWDTAEHHYTIIDNGLLKPWHGRVWLNPPYGGPDIVGPWMRRMVEHGHGTALIFARTETALFFSTVWRAATALLFIEGRLHFHHGARTYVPRLSKWFEIGERAAANAGAPSVLIAYGDKDAEILRGSNIKGQFVLLRQGGATIDLIKRRRNSLLEEHELMRKTLEIIAGNSADQLQATQARGALANIGASI